MNENIGAYNEEMEINLIDLMFYLLKQWKALVIVTVLGLLIGVGIYMTKSSSASKPEVPGTETAGEDMETAATAEFDDTVIANMEMAYKYRNLYERQVDYNQNSVLMRLDPNQVYSGTLRYYVAAGNNTEMVSQLYQNLLADQSVIKEIGDGAGLDCDERYIKELISVGVVDNGKLTVNYHGAAEDGEGTYEALQSKTISYGVVYSDQETCEKMLDIIREKVASLDQECRDKYGDYVLETVFEGTQFGINAGYLTTQKNNLDMESAHLSNIIRLESAFTDDELPYYKAVYLGREGSAGNKKESGTEEGVPEEGEALPVIQPKDTVSRWIFVGVLLAVACWAGFYLIKYLLDRHIKYAEEVQNYYGLHLIGRYQEDGKTVNVIERLREKAVNKNAGSYCSREYIASAINLLDMNSLLLVGDLEDEETSGLMQFVQRLCQKAECGSMMQNDSNALELAKGKNGIILFIKKGVSTYSEIQRELEICSLQNLHVAGAVVVE